MKKLIFILSLIFTLFVNAQEKDSIVILKTEIARKVVKDLVTGDFCLQELKITKTLVTDLENKVKLKDELIESHKTQFLLQKEITVSKVEQIDILKKELNNVKLKKTGGKILLYASIAANLFLLTKL